MASNTVEGYCLCSLGDPESGHEGEAVSDDGGSRTGSGSQGNHIHSPGHLRAECTDHSRVVPPSVQHSETEGAKADHHEGRNRPPRGGRGRGDRGYRGQTQCCSPADGG